MLFINISKGPFLQVSILLHILVTFYMSENAKYVTESHNIVMRVDFVVSIVFPAFNDTGLSDTL